MATGRKHPPDPPHPPFRVCGSVLPMTLKAAIRAMIRMTRVRSMPWQKLLVVTRHNHELRPSRVAVCGHQPRQFLAIRAVQFQSLILSLWHGSAGMLLLVRQGVTCSA